MSTKITQTPTWPFAGHAELGRHLIRLAEVQRLPSVMLFVGPRAVGKASGARWLAQRGLCTAGINQPCGNCPACRQVLTGTNPQALSIDPPAGESIGIEDIRLALHQYELSSWNQADRWLVIADAERLTEAASNTMLKFLEEMPSHLHVVFTSSEQSRLLPTLRSRTTTYQWHLVSVNDMPTVPANQRPLLNRSAGRPGWLRTLLTGGLAQTDAAEASETITKLTQPLVGRGQQLPKERAAVEKTIIQEELVVRDLLLHSVGSHRRLLWPQTTNTSSISASAAVTLATKYIERYHLSPNLQSKLLYEDLHLV